MLAYVVVMLFDFESGGGLQWVTDDEWISELGIRYSLGVDGINLFMIALTAVAWVPCTLVAALSPEQDRPRLFFFNLALAETAVLGAFMAQDLALFIVFFDLMLVPFYFLIGGWGSGDRVRATTKFVIYTLAGSLLMMAAAIALGVLATPDGRRALVLARRPRASARSPRARSTGSSCCSRSRSSSRRRCSRCTAGCPRPTAPPRSRCSRCCPACSRRSASTASCGSCCRSCRRAPQYWQELFIILAVFSILYGSILAFSQDNIRLVVAYSSIAQLGFIVLGIFALEEKGAQGALFQMLNHGLVVVPLFLIIGVIAAAGGRERVARGARAGWRSGRRCSPACSWSPRSRRSRCPGSANFVGEILILFGAFEDKLVYGLVASAGVVLAAVYMIRLYQGTMHGRVGPAVESREIDGVNLAAVAPLVAIVIALGVYPQFVVERTERDTGAEHHGGGAPAHPEVSVIR